MRIECENCNAAFTIGDALLSDQPIGAQCPYCGHVRVVSRGDAGAVPAAAPLPPAPQSLDRGFSGIDLSGPLGGPPNLGGGPPPMGGGGAPMGSGLGLDGSAALEQPPPPLDNDRFGPPDALDEDLTAAADSTACQVCGQDLVDEFDKVIGLCEVHQRDRTARAEQAAHEQAAAAADEAAALAAPAGTPATVSTGVKMPPIQRTFIAPAKHRPGSFGLKHVILLLFVAGLGVAGYFAYQNPEKTRELQRDLLAVVTGPPQAGPATLTNPLRPQLQRWRKLLKDVSGTPEEYIRAAAPEHLKDSAPGYAKAQELLQRALLLDEDSAVAVALYVENLVIWKGAILSNSHAQTADAALEFALQRAPDEAAVHRGRAALQLARGDLNGCRSAAERALKINPGDGQARLLMASSFLQGNRSLAIEGAEEALRLQPELRRTARMLARAHADAGRYRTASKYLDKRLKTDGRNVEVLMQQGKLREEMADYGRALDYYSRAVRGQGDSAAARLALARMKYGVRDYKGAASLYRKVLSGKDVYPTYMAEALTGLSRTELYRGRIDAARKHAQHALSLVPRDAAALLARAEVALKTGSATTAITFARRSLEARAGEPAALVVIGRAAVLGNDAEKALKALEEAVSNDPRDPRLKGIIASTYLAFGGSSQAFTVMAKVARMDPKENSGHYPRGLLSISDDAQREVITRFKKATKDKRNRSVAYSAMAVMYYHLRENEAARSAVSSALAADEANLTARLYQAQMALDRGRGKIAEEAGRTILDIERASPMGHLVLGRLYVKNKAYRDARDEFESSLRSAPGMTIAKIELAGLALQLGQKDAALETLKGVFGLYPSIRVTRSLLYRAGY